MSYDASQLASSAIYRIRFALQDTDEQNEFLADEELSYLLTKNNDDEQLTTAEAAKRMLAQFAQYTREREGLIEVYGNEIFDQWRTYLDDLVKELAGASSTSYFIVGGVNKTEVNRVKADCESVDGGYEKDFSEKNRDTITGSTSSSNPWLR